MTHYPLSRPVAVSTGFRADIPVSHSMSFSIGCWWRTDGSFSRWLTDAVRDRCFDKEEISSLVGWIYRKLESAKTQKMPRVTRKWPSFTGQVCVDLFSCVLLLFYVCSSLLVLFRFRSLLDSMPRIFHSSILFADVMFCYFGMRSIVLPLLEMKFCFHTDLWCIMSVPKEEIG